MQQLRWVCKPFIQLSSHELYDVIKLRNEVFVVEQNCIFQDADDKDQECHHLMGYIEDRLAAYARLVPVGVSYDGLMSIGRVITSPAFRRVGAGRALMQKAIEQCFLLFGVGDIKIGAQLYLKHFYESFGFEQTSEMYLEDDIPHIEMLRKDADFQ